jgi:3-hydroxyisobutyrate dehydrogenase-like beta-hydroxyacid dehydrogenase
MTDSLALGFIGLGQMGGPMAGRLADWPGGLIVHDLRAEATAPLAERGARVAGSPAEVAEFADLVSVMVLDDEQVGEVARALATAAAERGRPAVIAIHSTIGAATAPELAAELAGAGLEIVDAPVSGGFMGAHEGTLAVMFGGSRAAYELCKEPFGRWASLVMYMGEVGAGTRTKLARNLLHFASFSAAAEAQRLAEAAGLDLRKLARVVRHSDAVTGGAGSIMLRDSTAPLIDDDPLRPILEHVRALGEKDLELALALGAELGVPLPFAELAMARFAAGLGLPARRGRETQQ